MGGKVLYHPANEGGKVEAIGIMLHSLLGQSCCIAYDSVREIEKAAKEKDSFVKTEAIIFCNSSSKDSYQVSRMRPTKFNTTTIFEISNLYPFIFHNNLLCLLNNLGLPLIRLIEQFKTNDIILKMNHYCYWIVKSVFYKQ